MPVNPSPARLCYALCMTVLCLTMSHAQVLVGGSLYEDRQQTLSTSHIWLQYANSFEFKEGMSIDTDMGNIFYTGTERKRMNVRSTFKYRLLDDLQIGAGMGFFWFYGSTNPAQELRFHQVVSYHKDFESGTMQHDLALEQQILETSENGKEFQSRLRYKLGYVIPTRGPLYFGFYDEIFAVLNPKDSDPLISMNRLAGLIGYNTFDFFKIEAQVMMQNQFVPVSGIADRSWVFQIGIKQII